MVVNSWQHVNGWVHRLSATSDAKTIKIYDGGVSKPPLPVISPSASEFWVPRYAVAPRRGPLRADPYKAGGREGRPQVYRLTYAAIPSTEARPEGSV
jgi:hypothetical protein